jgi:hypothetical protein
LPEPIARLPAGGHILAFWRVSVLVLAALSGVLAIAVVRKYGFGHRGPVLDYVVVWSGARLALQGAAASAYNNDVIGPVQRAAVDMAAPGIYPYFYPPIALLLFAPLAALPYGISFLLFTAAQWTFLVTQLRRLLPAPWPLSTIIAAPAALVSLGIGQNGCLTAGLMAASCATIERSPYLAGAALGALAFKPHLAVLVPVVLALGRQWRALIAATAAVAILIAASLVFGLTPWLDFAAGSAKASAVMREFPSLWPKLISPFASLRLAGVGLHPAYAAQAAAACIALAALVRCRKATGAWLVALMAAATLLVSPYLYDYDLPLSLVPVALVVAGSHRGVWLPGEKLVCALVFAAPLIVRPVATISHTGLMPLVSLALLAIAVRRARADAAHRSIESDAAWCSMQDTAPVR